ncbi:hypothetical protein IJG12_02345 [Candidatus Saccharibacteria bacterium]|nr:hypothetical protein [Candidatus Saccharibacteria bacterium]
MANHEKLRSKDDNSEWNEVAKMAKDFRKEQINKAPENAKTFYRNVYEYQKSFEKRSATIKANGERMSQKEFETWEDLVADELALAEKEGEKGNFGIEQTAECAQMMVTSTNDAELHKTIEAQAGNYYYERMDALRQAIEKSDDEDKKESLDYLKGFYPAVVEHLDFKYMSPDDVRDYGYDEYESKRTRVHNNVIKHLNGVNDLARKYHVRPLTVRNFWSSDLVRMSAQTPAISKVMRFDRDVVEEYYEIAFSSEVKRRKAKQERDMRWNFM